MLFLPLMCTTHNTPGSTSNGPRVPAGRCFRDVPGGVPIRGNQTFLYTKTCVYKNCTTNEREKTCYFSLICCTERKNMLFLSHLLYSLREKNMLFLSHLLYSLGVATAGLSPILMLSSGCTTNEREITCFFFVQQMREKKHVISFSFVVQRERTCYFSLICCTV